MAPSIPFPLVAWENFYVIIGSSGGALTGLMFVVITLIDARGGARSHNTIDAFGTPTIVHFCTVLLLSAILSAPWPRLGMAAILLGIIGLVGVFYCGVVFRRGRRQSGYTPVAEDWIWHIILPFIAYLSIAAGAIRMTANLTASLFALASASLLLLFIGIHNAWDTVTYVVVDLPARPAATEPNEQH